MQYSTSEFEKLYAQCFPSSIRLAMSLLHDEDEARDVVHEVFLKLWESDMEIASPQAFVLRAVRNASLNRINSLDIRERIRQRLMLEPPDGDYDFEARHEAVRHAVRQLLTQREREVIDKVYADGLSYKDTADSLGVSIAAVNKHVVTALRKLRTHFKPGKS